MKLQAGRAEQAVKQRSGPGQTLAPARGTSTLISFVSFNSFGVFMSPTATDAAIAADALESGRLVIVSENGEPVDVPDSIRSVIADVLDHARRGETIRIVSDNDEITTGQAAELLNVSRPYLVGLVDAGEIPSRKVGTRRRLRLIDVIRYRDIEATRQTAAVRDLAREAQELGLY
jgi:excisionase family DNA binding protein